MANSSSNENLQSVFSQFLADVLLSPSCTVALVFGVKQDQNITAWGSASRSEGSSKTQLVGKGADWKPPNRPWEFFTQALTCPGVTCVSWQLNFSPDASHVWSKPSLSHSLLLFLSSKTQVPRVFGYVQACSQRPCRPSKSLHRGTLALQSHWGINSGPQHVRQHSLDTDGWADKPSECLCRYSDFVAPY